MLKIKLFQEFIKEELRTIVSDSSSSGRTKYIDTILDDIPSSTKSLSSGILLRQDLKDKEFDDFRRSISSNIPDYVVRNLLKGGVKISKFDKFRVTLNNLEFLKYKSKEGDLYCEYCEKGPLVIYDFNPDEITSSNINNSKYRFNTKFKESDGATADHRQPQSKGGDKFNYDNLAVCCYRCNRKKGDMSWDQWNNYLKQKEEI